MVEEGPYEILPYAEIEKLKKQVEDLRKKTASSEEVLDGINRLARIVESMLHLFESAASGMKKEGEGALGKKLDKILEQNETIAESILSLSDTIKELQPKEKEPYIVRGKPQPIMPEPAREPIPGVEPDFSMPPPGFERPRISRPTPPKQGPMPGPLPRQGPPPMPPVPPRGEGPIPAPSPSPMEPMPPKEGPVPMPTGSFKDLELGKPKKGLFGRFRK